MREEKNVLGCLLGPIVAAVALVVFCVTLSRYAYPGQSSSMIVQYGGMLPLLSPNLPLWGWLFHVAWRLPLGDAVIRVNALSALFGAVGVWLLYHVVSTGVAQLVNPSDLSEQRGIVISRVAGVVAALALCFSVPYWVVATRAHNATFDVCLLLGALAVLIAYARSSGLAWLYVLAFIWGIGTVEYASFIIFFPLVLIAVLLLMWQKGQLRPLPVISALACGLLGLSLYLVAAWHFYGTDGYVMREYPSYLKVVWFMWRDQYRLITRSLPREGWLIIILTTGVPWLVGLGVARRGINDASEWSDYLLHLVLSLLCGLVLLNLNVAPWALLGHARLLVMPYVLTAALTGYLVAYWLRQALAWGETPSTKFKALVVRGSGVLLLLALAGTVGAAPIRNYADVDTSAAGVLADCAEMIVDLAQERGTAEGRSWIITDGMFDDVLQIVAYEKDVPLTLFDLRNGENEGYRRYVSTFFDSARLKNLARIGLMPLLGDLLAGEHSISEQTLIFAAPDIWMLAGRMPVPDRLVSRGVTSLDDIDVEALYSEHLAFWEAITEKLTAVNEGANLTDPAARLAHRLLMQSSLMANNLGVCLEDKESPVLAFDAYAKALDLVPGNVSATLNMNRMLDQGFESARAEELRSALAELKASDRRYDVLALSRVYGYVRDPQAFSGIARTWALTGQPGMAAQSLEKALDLVDADQQGAIKGDLAGLYLGQSRDEESEALFYELLVEDPENHKALMGLARIAARKGAFDKAQSLRDQAEAAGVPADALAMERAVVAILQSDVAAARRELEALVREDESRLGAWRLLVDILTRSQDWLALERASERLRGRQDGVALAAEVQAVLALRDADIGSAKRYYAEALTVQPNNLRLLERALRLELMSANLPGAQDHARTILRLDGSHAIANYVIGAARLVDGEMGLAEEALRRSLARERLPQALNDLAWLLHGKKAYVEAESLAREATELRPTMHQAWDTLGDILMEMNRLPEAELAMQKALSLTENSVGTFLHMAQLQAAKGDNDHAREIMLMIADRVSRLSSEDKREFDILQRTLNDG